MKLCSLLFLLTALSLHAQSRFFSLYDEPSYPGNLLVACPDGGALVQYVSPTLEDDAGLIRLGPDGRALWKTTYRCTLPGSSVPLPLHATLLTSGPERIASIQSVRLGDGEEIESLTLFNSEGTPLWMKGLVHQDPELQLKSIAFRSVSGAEQHDSSVLVIGEFLNKAGWPHGRHYVVTCFSGAGKPQWNLKLDSCSVDGTMWEAEQFVRTPKGLAIIGPAGSDTTKRRNHTAIAILHLDAAGSVQSTQLFRFDSLPLAVSIVELIGTVQCSDGFVVYGTVGGTLSPAAKARLTTEDYADVEGFVARFGSDGNCRWARMAIDFVPNCATVTSAGDVVLARWIGDQIIRFDSEGNMTAHHRVVRTDDRTTVLSLGDIDVAPPGALDFAALASLPDGTVLASGTIYPRWRTSDEMDSAWPRNVSMGVLHLDSQLRSSCALLLPDTVDVFPITLSRHPFALSSSPLPLPETLDIDVTMRRSVPAIVDLCTHDWPLR